MPTLMLPYKNVGTPTSPVGFVESATPVRWAWRPAALFWRIFFFGSIRQIGTRFANISANSMALAGADAVLHLTETGGSVQDLELKHMPPSKAA
ncbi:hypothetical protein AU467_31600 [Mesorhizobium loti]|uniref:Uncharacterized protein n=1 Tax=Rhizobium loti TaxID=381 RepID=A0A101KNJ4_RHILI|nr:hypothetical protein AU467_31600 [Mesorhizobium loti]